VIERYVQEENVPNCSAHTCTLSLRCLRCSTAHMPEHLALVAALVWCSRCTANVCSLMSKQCSSLQLYAMLHDLAILHSTLTSTAPYCPAIRLILLSLHITACTLITTELQGGAVSYREAYRTTCRNDSTASKECSARTAGMHSNSSTLVSGGCCCCCCAVLAQTDSSSNSGSAAVAVAAATLATTGVVVLLLTALLLVLL
jgi:hypothetical protein